MSMKKNTARRVLGTAMLAVGVLFFTACPREIGLGSAVDTQKPVITIATPDADSILRGDITLTGTVTDDLAVKSVSVTFSSTSEPSLASKTFEAVVDAKNNSWSLTVNTKDAARGLPDSSYEAVATATDKSNKSSTASRSFSIDNTAPTVLITSPSLYGGNNRTQFCNQIRIEGEAFDISEISVVQVYLCNAAGNVVAGPKDAGGKTSWTALFSSDDLTDLIDDEIYYFYAIATDKAGNKNDSFYHKADILGLPDGANPIPTVEEISRLDRGVTAGNSARVTAANLQTVRIGTGVEGITAGCNSSKGYPDFTYTTQASAAILWTNLGDDLTTSMIGVGSAIFATIQPPTDNSAILLDSINVDIRTVEGDVYGDWVGQTGITKQKVGESVNISINPKVNGVNLTEGTYEVALSCNTNSGSSIGSEKGFQVNSDAPKVEESSIYNGSQPGTAFAQGVISGNTTSPKLSGRFLRANGSVMQTLATGSFSITCKDSTGATVGVYSTDNGITYNGTNGTWTFPLSLGNGAGKLSDDTYTFTISGTLGEALTMITRVVTVDTTAPDVTLVSPTADSVITIAQNGTGFTFQGNAVDTGSGVATTYWCIDKAGVAHSTGDTGATGVANAEVLGDDEVPVKGKWYKFSTPTVFNLQPNLSGYEEQNYKAYVFTKDAAGYISEAKVVPFFIDNAKPVLSVTSWPTLVRKNVDGMTISGKAYDTSGALEKVYVSFDGHDAIEVKDLSSGTYTSSSQADWMFPGSAVISAGSWTDGTHTLAFSVKDKAGRTSDVVTNTFTIDNVAPVVTVANLTNNQVFSGMSTPISGTAIDSLSGISKVQYSSAGASTTESSWHDATNDSGAWSINLGNLQSEDSQTIRIRAIDNAGNIAYSPAGGTSDITFFIDKANPLATIEVNTTNAVMNGDTVMTKNSFSLKGLANDTAAGTTGREAKSVKLTYTKDGGSAVTAFTADSNSDRWTKGTDSADNKTGKWNWTPASNFAEGFYTFTLTVTDSADKVTTTTQSIRYDKTAPVLVITTPAEGEPFAEKKITMKGSVSDDGSGVDKIYFTLDGSDPTTSSLSITPTGNSWSYEKTFDEEGAHELRMKAVDKLGNTSTIEHASFSYDKNDPSLNVLSVQASGLTTNADFKIAGTAWDTNDLDYITVSDGTTTWSSDTSKSGTGTVAGVTLTKKKANPGTAEANWNWNLNFGVGSSTSGIHFDDGTATFTVTAKDVAGKTKTATRTVTVDTTLPVISNAAVENALVCLDESKYDRFTVTATDTGTGLAGVYYKIVDSSASAPSFTASNESTWSALALGSGNEWAANVDFTGKAEGSYKIYAAAKDNAGNRKRYATATAVKVDSTKPVVTVTGDTATGSADVNLTVKITDTNAKEPVISISGAGKTSTNPTIGTPTSGAGFKTWTVKIPVSEYADGLYTITVTGKDDNNRTSVPVTHTIRRDTTPPAVNTIDAPVAGMTGVNALYGSSYLFQGTAKDKADGSTDCAGLAMIKYAFTRTDSAPADSAYTELAMTDGSWSITKKLNSGTSAAETGNLYEGTWYLHVLAVDKAGNCTSTRAVRSFDIDMSAPDLSITSPGSSPYTKEANFTISGTASDTNGLAKKNSKDTISVKVGSSAAADVEVAANGEWSYTYARTDANKDQNLSVTVTAKDVAGRETEKTATIYFDTQAPEITITTPASGESLSPADGKYTLTGTVADVGAGVSTTAGDATYIIKKGSTTVASGNLAVTGASWTAANASLGSSEGSLTLAVTIKDKLGQAATVGPQTFYYDKENPHVGNISISASGLTTNAGFTLAGTAWDTNELDCITVSDGTHTWSSGDSPATVTLVKKTADPGNAAADRNWHIDFVVGSGTSGDDFHIDDGTTNFTITVKDVAGKTVTQTRTVTVDTSVPSITAASAAATGEVPAGKVYLDVSKYKQFTVTATDTGTGLAGIYYQVLASNASAPTFTSDTGWTSLAQGDGDDWAANIDFSSKAEGDYKIYAAAKDKAGNRTLYGTATTITVDEKKPVTKVTGASDAKNEDVELTIIVEDTNPQEPVVTVLKPKADGSAGGTALSAADADLNISGPDAVTGGQQWTVTVPFGSDAYSADGIYTVKVNETDECGRVADEKAHTIRRDTTAPAVNTIDAPIDGKTGVNALYGTSYLFQGTAKDKADGSADCAGLAKILYAFTRSASAPSSSQYTELAMSDGTWSITKKLNSGTSATETGNLYEGTWYLHVLAEDKAGNRTATRAVRSFDIDMSAPSLSITKADSNTLTDLTKTIYTKGNNIKFEGTASDTNGLAKNAGNKTYVTVQIDDATPAEAIVASDGTWSYTYNRTDANKDQLHSVTVKVTDVVGKTEEKTAQFYFDMTPPSVTISLPAANETTTSNTYTFTGTVADVGSGVAKNPANATYATAKAKYIIKKGTDTVASGPLTVNGASWRADNVELGDEDSEGKLDLTITIEDELGWSTSADRVFYKDLNPPELRVLSVSSSGLTTKDNFKIGGTAWDTNELDYVTVSDGSTTWTSAGDTPDFTLTKKTADPQPGDDSSKWNWCLNFDVDGTTSGIHVGDGTKTFTITAKDVSGKTVTATRTVTVDRTAPSITAASTVAAGGVAADKVFLDVSVYKQLNVTASDAGTGLASVYYQISTSTSAPAFTDATEANWKSLALSGSDSWSGNADFTGKAEGTQYIFVAAKDKIGNRTVYNDKITLTVDKQLPVISITGTAAGSAPITDTGAEEVTVVIHMADTNPDDLEVTIQKPNADGSAGGDEMSETDAALTIADPETETSGKKWSVTIPFGNDEYDDDGFYTITVNGTDTRGRAAVVATHKIRKDVTAPTASISTPVAGKTGANALFGDSYRFTGTAADNDNGSGLAKVLYAFTASSGAPASTAYTALDVTDENWTVTMDLVAGKTPVTGKLCEGSWYLHVLAEDKAGNRTANADRAVRTFDIDLAAPEIAITKAGGVTLTDLTKTNFTKANNIKLEGTASDSNGVASVTVKVGDGDAASATYTAATGKWEYTVTQTADNKDQLLTATVTVTDVAGKTAVKTVPFYFDTQAPTVSITQPASGAITNTNAYTLNGTAADVGAGIAKNTAEVMAEYAAAATTAERKAEIYAAAKAKYIIKKGSDTVSQGLLSVTDANWSASVNLDANSLTKKEGELTLTIYLEDILGNKATGESVTRTFFYDKNPPVITETGIGSSLITNEAFTFSGTASDTNALLDNGTGAIQITATKTTASGTTDAVDETVDVDGSGAWTKTYTPGSSSGQLADGTYNFTFVVTDVAGRTATTTSTVIVDKGVPTVSREAGKTSFLTDTPTETGSWFKKEYLGLKAIVADNEGGSGISMVEYAVISNPASAPTSWTGSTIDWNTMTKGTTGAYTANAQVAGGTNYICIRATDKAGNVTYGTQETAKVDLRAPTILGVYTDADCTAALSNSTYLTCKQNITLYLKVSESANNGTPAVTGSGIDSLKVTMNGHDVTATAVTGKTDTYKITVTGANLDSYLSTEGAHVVSAVISDVAGNSTSVSQLFTLQYDKTAPVVAFTKPSAGSTVNKTITVSGTTTESQSLESVILYAGTVSAANKLTEFTGNDRFNWTYTLNTFDNTNSPKTYVASSGSMTLNVVAKDTAGNTTTESCTFTVNQSKDCPEITITNIKFSGMTSAIPKQLKGSKTIYGSVTDDDGSIKKLEISTNGTDWQELTVTNGSFTTKVTVDGEETDYLEDGQHTILFRVKDNNDAVFTTADSTALNRPVLKGSDASVAADNKLYLIVDTENPEAPTPTFSLTGADGSWSAELLNQKTFSKSLAGVSSETGAATFWVRQLAKDANGINKVEVAIGNGSYSTATAETNADGTRKEDSDGYNIFKYQVTTAQIAAAASGTQAVKVRVTDNVGNTTDVTANFAVDNDAPVMEISSHAQNEYVKGEFYVGGTTNDAPKNTGAKSLIYKVTASATRPADNAWGVEPVSNLTYAAHEIDSDNLASWRIYFDNDFASDGYAHDRTFKQVLVSIPEFADYLTVNNDKKVVYSRDYPDSINPTHLEGEEYTGPNNGYVQLYIHFKATDAFNNTSYSSIPLMFDPQGDIPSVAISYPGATAYGWQHTTVTHAGQADETRTATVIYTAKATNLKTGDFVYSTIDAVSKNTSAGTITAVDAENKTITATIGGNAVTYTYFGGACVQGGVIRVQGTAIAEGANTVSGVYIQIDPTYDPAYGFQWTDDNTAGSELLPYGGLVEAQRPADKRLSKKYTIAAIGGTGKKGISVGSSGAWNISLNGSGEFDSTGSESNLIAVRAVVIDDKNNVSPITENIIITVDSDTPRIGASEQLVLVQYANNAAGTGAITASQNYTDDMWLKGEWWLTGSVEDSNGITSLSVAGNDILSSSTAKTWNAGTASKTDGYVLKYKIGSTESNKFGTLTYKISAEDGDTPHKLVEKTVSVRYDNKAPVLAGTTDPDFNIKKEVVQKNGFYTLGSAVVEAGDAGNVQSGFDKLALYFIRGTGNTARLFDTYFLKSDTDSSGNSLNEVPVSSLTYDTSDGLYYLPAKTVGHSGESKIITLSAADQHIHTGGMVKIRDALYIIKSMSDDKKTLTLDRELADLGATETAHFAMAMIVDNTQTEKAGVIDTNGYYKPSNSDDGDCMLESVNTSNGTTNWEANICSRNIPDGAITIHYVAFDKAGNSAHDSFNGTVANNAPRLAGVWYGVDNNGDGDVTKTVDSKTGEITEDSELKSKLFAIDKGKYVDSDLRTSYILKKSAGDTIEDDDALVTIKGAVKVVPEIVGGNGTLYYSWSVTDGDAAAPYYSIGIPTDSSGNLVPLKDTNNANLTGSDYSGKGTASEINEGSIIITLEDLLTKITVNNAQVGIKDGDAGKNQVFTFTIWDSTEGMTPGSLEEGVGSQRAELKLVADVKLQDNVKPVPTIKPFYWINKDDNSVRKVVQNKKTTLYGHIDLSQDLPVGKFPTSNTSGEFDRDDKVSGAIFIEGTVHDDTLLSGIYMKIFTETNTKTDMFTFTGSSGTKDGHYKVATYNKATGWGGTLNAAKDGKIVSGNYANDGWQFEIMGTDTFNAEGHTTNWRLTLNTEKLNSVVVNDLKVSVIAEDMGKPTLNGSTITYAHNTSTAGSSKTTDANPTSFNRFDVVPYITKLGTSIAESAGDEFARSALGRYSIRKGEEIKIYGYNLDLDDTTVILGSAAGNQTGDITLTNSAKQTGDTFVRVSIDDVNGTSIDTVSTLGYIKVTVGGSESLNNINENDALGDAVDEEGTTVTPDDLDDETYDVYAYNYMPNNTTNNRLTDDVRIWVWKMGAFVNGTSITSPMMKMDNASNWYMSYGRGTAEMYVNKNGSTRRVDYSWNKFHNTSVGFDSQGRLWAAAMNTDRVQDVSSRYVLYAPAGTNGLPEAETQGFQYSYDRTSSSKRHLEFAYNDNTNNGNGYYDVDRVKNSKIVTADINGKTYVAVAYYDGNNTINPVKIRFGMELEYEYYASGITFTRQNSITTYGMNSNTSNGTVSGWTINGNPNYTDKYVEINGVFYKITRNAYYGKKTYTQSYYYTLEGYTGTGTITNATLYSEASFGMGGGLEGKLPNGSTGSGNNVSMVTNLDMSESNNPSKNDTSARGYHIVASNGTDYKSGSHVAAGIVPDEDATNGYVGVVAWYDASAKRLAFSYNTDPDTPQVAGNVAQGTVDQWATHAFYVDAMYTGWYVDMAIDDDGGIHMAYYDSKSGDLKYAYMESYDAGTATVKTVDSYLSVGTNISMTIRKEGTGTNARQVPYIYYYNASATQTTNSIRVAWQEENDLDAGASSDKYTGSWEVMTIPTANIPVDATVCGGAPTSGGYANQIVLGYMTDACYERAVLLK